MSVSVTSVCEQNHLWQVTDPCLVESATATTATARRCVLPFPPLTNWENKDGKCLGSKIPKYQNDSIQIAKLGASLKGGEDRKREEAVPLLVCLLYWGSELYWGAAALWQKYDSHACHTCSLIWHESTFALFAPYLGLRFGNVKLTFFILPLTIVHNIRISKSYGDRDVGPLFTCLYVFFFFKGLSNTWT